MTALKKEKQAGIQTAHMIARMRKKLLYVVVLTVKLRSVCTIVIASVRLVRLMFKGIRRNAAKEQIVRLFSADNFNSYYFKCPDISGHFLNQIGLFLDGC